jgi:uncharacterized OsmC-like protein
MGSVVYVAKVRIEPEGLLQRAVLPGGASLTFDEYRPVPRRISGAVQPDEHPEPIDYVVAAVGASLAGSFTAGLEKRGVALGPDDLATEVQGDVEKDTSEIGVIKRIRVRYYVRVPPYRREVVERVLAIHAEVCPLARTLKGCVAIGTVVEYR